MKQLTQSEIRKNGKVYKNVSSPATEGTMKQVTDIVEKDGTFSISTDGGKTYSPASGAVPEALPQEASALKSGNLPTTGWEKTGFQTFWEGTAKCDASTYKPIGTSKALADILYSDDTAYMMVDYNYQYYGNYDKKNAKFSYKNSNASVGSMTGISFRSGSQVDNPTIFITRDGTMYGRGSNFASSAYSVTYTRIGTSTISQQFYTISDTSITANSDILMELTDDGGVKAYSMESGKITVIRDTVPTGAIPYTYKVKQTNASGQFTLVNHFVPNVPVMSVNGQTGAVTIAVPTKTSELTNDSGFLTKNNIVAGDNVTVTDENGNVKISATGGGSGGGVTYTKLIGSVDFTTTAYTDDPYFLGQNAATWSENSAVGNKALTSTTDIGLFIGTSYTMAVNIQGTSSMFSAKAEDGSPYGLQGSKVLWFKREGISAQFFIYDHCTIVGENIVAGDGCIFVADLGSDITIAGINYFSGNRGVITPVTITNSAIKINSAVTMYINSSLVVSGTKTDGSITLTASTEGSVSYEMEILNTSTEGLFEVINAYVPDVPTKTSQLENDRNFATTADIPTKTSQLQNDSGFVSVGEWKEWTSTSILTEEGLYEIVTTEYPNDGNKTFFVQYEQGKLNNGACWVSVLTAGGVMVVSPICSGDGTLRVERSSSNSSTTDPLSFKYRKITN